jgi:hypothetical protein
MFQARSTWLVLQDSSQKGKHLKPHIFPMGAQVKDSSSALTPVVQTWQQLATVQPRELTSGGNQSKSCASAPCNHHTHARIHPMVKQYCILSSMWTGSTSIWCNAYVVSACKYLFNEGMNTFFPLNPNAASEPLVQQ